MSRRHRRQADDWRGLETGDVCLLVDGGQVPALYDVTWDGGVPLFGSQSGDATGVITIWAVTVPSAPYKNESQTATGALAAGGVARCTPASLVLAPNELVQARLKMRLIDTAGGSGAKIDNFSLRAYLPGASSVWGTNANKGVYSPRMQIGDPSDLVSAPLQDAAMVASVTNSRNGYESAFQTELWWYGVNTQPAFEVVWNGVAATPAGIAIGLEVSGFRYILAPHAGGRRVITRAGMRIALPDDVEWDDVTTIVTNGRAA